MMKSIRLACVVCLVITINYSAKAWGLLGHRIVGEIADSYLTAKTKAEIKKILGTESIGMSSNWADFIKSDTSYRYLNAWHYINLDKGLSRAELVSYFKKDTAVDLYTKMNFVVKELKKKTLSIEQKRFYLRLLIHFVGDAHQPLHTGRKENRGGNDVKVRWFSEATNLHTVWDERLVDFQQLSYTEHTKHINHTTLKQRKFWQSQPVAEWLIESYEISEQLYGEIKEDNQRLWYDYNFRHIGTVNERLLKGGVRLAGLLNSIFN